MTVHAALSVALSTALSTALLKACDSLGLVVSPSQHQAMLRYLALLQQWNATYNLTAIREPAQMVTHHLADSLSGVNPLRARLPELTSATRLLDAGSGAGLPGLVLALMQPGLTVSCVDSVGKKVSFIRQSAAEMGLRNVEAVHSRLENLVGHQFDIVASRAFSSLGGMVATTRHLLSPRGEWMAMKGKRPDTEMRALPPDIDVFHVEHLQVPGLDAERCIVWMRRK